MISTKDILVDLARYEHTAASAGLNSLPALLVEARYRLSYFTELLALLTGRDTDEYLRDAFKTGYPPLTDPGDVRTTVLGDRAPTNEIPK
jgi:hypothetical protein